MQEVVDRLQFQFESKKFLTKDCVLVEGVLVTSTQWWSDKSHKECMQQKLYPIADKFGAVSLMRHITFDRKFPKKNGVDGTYNPRGGKIFGSRDTLCDFMAKVCVAPSISTPLKKLFNPTSIGFYWESYHPQKLYVHPYIDIDIKVPPGECKFNDVFNPIGEVMKLMEEAIMEGTRITEVHALVLMNTRDVVIKGTTYTKWSFHLHWPQVVVANMTELSQLVGRVGNHVPKQPNGQPLLDTKPYAAQNQLFRMPYCGKMGEGGSSLQPIIPYQDKDQQVWKWKESTVTMSDVLNQSCTATPFPDKFNVLIIDAIPRSIGQAPSTMAGVVSPSAENQDDLDKWMRFWRPVLTQFVVPNFIEFRQKKAKGFGVPACSYPDTGSIIINKIARMALYPASFRLEIVGDLFCEYDHGLTPYTHSYTSNATSYVVDLHKGRICQQCVKCRPAHFEWYSFIRSRDLTFPIMDREYAVCESAEFVGVGPHTPPDPIRAQLLPGHYSLRTGHKVGVGVR